ncbi:polyphosphate kinase 1 [Ruminococcus sp. NK3A76]|uniref:polyphosphate kinase 1 n=1 Tax=Ruminococcus sp. NK3A76 TaxID=877411 RepID=UPI000691A2D9|nr:polyphosphate kinase 1 [Ruminococcus sp. NK3A76]
MAKKYLENRELSWLKFNYRVLEEARDNSVPLLERLTFASIFLSNLDEFYRVRVGALVRQSLDDDNQREARTGLRPSTQLEKIYKRTRKLYELFDITFSDIELGLAAMGAVRKTRKTLTDGEKTYCSSFAEHELKPKLRMYENAKSFFAENGRVYYAVMCDNGIHILDYTGDHSPMIGLNVTDKAYILISELVRKYAADIVGSKPLAFCTFRVTRSAALDLDTDYMAERDRREEMRKLVLRRKKMPIVRLEICGCTDKSLKDAVCRLLRTTDDITFERVSPLDFGFVGDLRDRFKDNSSLFYKKQPPCQSPLVSRDETMMSQIEKRDILLFYPYEDIMDFVRLLDEAAADPRVKRISITLYRAASDSAIIDALCNAGKNGKDVLALVELRARFDEENNIFKAEKLEASGCRVIFGLPGIKVHSKLCLIEYTDGDETKYITQIGTGNYNEKTSRLYTDLSLMTSAQDIAADAVETFKKLEEGRLVESSDTLMISPLCLKSRIIDMMDAEITAARSGGEGYIGAKINSLTDSKVIKKLVECSQAGVKVELVVRGICCLVPGVEGKTDNIKVISIVGRYLEHARIYIFGNSSRRKVYISSADFMTRNLSRRVEAAAPIRDEEQRDRVFEYFRTELSDKVRGRVLCPDGIYRRENYDDGDKDSQQILYDLAVENEKGITSDVILEQKPVTKSEPAVQPETPAIEPKDIVEADIPQAPEPVKPDPAPAAAIPQADMPIVVTPAEPIQQPRKRGFLAWLKSIFSK